MNPTGSKTWMVIVRILMVALTAISGGMWWWMKGVTLMAVETKQTVAVNCNRLTTLENRFERFDGKLDKLLERTAER